MASGRMLENLLEAAPEAYDITLFNAEKRGNYKRLMLSPVLSGEKTYAEIVTHDAAWYAENGVATRFGASVVGIDRDRKFVVSAGGETPYDKLVPATGSAPFILPVSGRDLPGVVTFHTADGRARMVAIAPRLPDALSPGQFRLNTGRIRDPWHSMTRTAQSPRLSQHLAEPYVEINPADAGRLRLAPADLVQVHNDLGRAILRVLISDVVSAGQIFAPLHWTGDLANAARIDAQVPAVVDPVSGQPDSKSAGVALRRYPASWYGFAVSAGDLRPKADYRAKSRVRGGWRMELAGLVRPENWTDYANGLFGFPDGAPVILVDRAKGLTRLAYYREGRMIAALFTRPEPVALSRDHLAGQIMAPGPATLLANVLAGAPGVNQPDPGPTSCACLNVGRNTILRAIADRSACTLSDLGTLLGAGTACGSCRPELNALLAFQMIKQAAG